MLIGDVWITHPMIAEISEMTGCHRTTVARWIERRELPPTVRRYLRIVLHGRLDDIHPAWSGWSIDTRRGEMVTPAGDCFMPGHIQSIQYRLHQVAHLKAELREVKSAVADARVKPPKLVLVPR